MSGQFFQDINLFFNYLRATEYSLGIIKLHFNSEKQPAYFTLANSQHLAFIAPNLISHHNLKFKPLSFSAPVITQIRVSTGPGQMRPMITRSQNDTSQHRHANKKQYTRYSQAYSY